MSRGGVKNEYDGGTGSQKALLFTVICTEPRDFLWQVEIILVIHDRVMIKLSSSPV